MEGILNKLRRELIQYFLQPFNNSLSTGSGHTCTVRKCTPALSAPLGTERFETDFQWLVNSNIAWLQNSRITRLYNITQSLFLFHCILQFIARQGDRHRTVRNTVAWVSSNPEKGVRIIKTNCVKWIYCVQNYKPSLSRFLLYGLSPRVKKYIATDSRHQWQIVTIK